MPRNYDPITWESVKNRLKKVPESEYVYKHGLPFSEKLAENLVDEYNRVQHENKAACVIIDGGVGEGKTTLALLIADFMNFLHGHAEIELELKNHPQIGMGGREFIKGMRLVFSKGFVVLIYDEGGDFNKRGALTQFNQMLNRLFETYRAFKVLVIICLPSFDVIDRDLLKKNIPRLLIHCECRTQTYGNFKAYSLYRMFYISDHMKSLKVPSFAYEIVHPNFYGHFLNLTPTREKLLDKICTNAKLLETEKAEIKMDGLISMQDVARKLAKTLTWVSIAVKELRIKPERKISRTQYYKEDVILEALWSHRIRTEENDKRKNKIKGAETNDYQDL